MRSFTGGLPCVRMKIVSEFCIQARKKRPPGGFDRLSHRYLRKINGRAFEAISGGVVFNGLFFRREK
jgi:hypothetical protein